MINVTRYVMVRLAALGVLTVLFAGGVCASALAVSPNWRLGTRTLPTNLPAGGSGKVLLSVENVGDAVTTSEAVTVVDHLPAGVTATAAGALESAETTLEVPGPWECAGVGTQTVTCTYVAGAITPVSFGSYSKAAGVAPSIGIEVAVEAGTEGESLTNEATIMGGGATLPAKDTDTFLVSSAPPPFGLASIHSWFTNADGTPDVQAGSHPYEMTTSLFFNLTSHSERPEGEVKDLHVDLPVGFVGNPNATPRCPRLLFDRRIGGKLTPDCPPDSQVGTASLYVEPNSFAYLPIYNLVPPPGLPAQLGFAYTQKLGLLDAGVNTGGSYSLSVTDLNVPQTGVQGAVISLWGNPADASHNFARFRAAGPGPAGEEGEDIPYGSTPRPFLSLPDVCGVPLELGVSLDSWANPVSESPQDQFGQGHSFYATDASNNPVTLEGCGSLPFDPSFSLQPEGGTPDSPMGLTTQLSFPQRETVSGVAESNLKEVSVTLPQGVAVSPSAANGLAACSEEQVALASPGPASCPEASKLGRVIVHSPALQGPLEGSLYVAQQGNLAGNGSNPFGSLFALYLVAEGEGVRVKLPGKVSLDAGTGQVTARFGEDPVTSAATGKSQFVPDLPIGSVSIQLFGGERAALVSPPACGSFTGSAQLTPWSTGSALERTSGFAIGANCATGGFTPTVNAGTVSNRGATSSTFTATISRADGEQRFRAVRVVLPQGLTGVLKNVVRCGEPQASQGTCGPESLIGEATIAAGPGHDPFWVRGGKVYLTGSYAGAPFGLSVVVPAVAGPFNLGVEGKPIVVRARVDVDPHTAQVVVTTEDPIPTILQGVPLDIRTINVSVNRPGFILNPTSCAPLAITGTVTSTSATQTALSTPFEASDCAKLPFAPVITAITDAKTSKANGAYLHVKVSTPPGQANIAKTKLDLPLQLPSRLTTLQKACLAKIFEADPANCPAGSLVGTGTAITPLLTSPLIGPAYLVSYGGAKFPDLVFVLQGEGITIDLVGETDIKKGVTSETLNTIPDAPVTSFDAVFREGKASILAANLPAKAKYSMCGQTLKMPAALQGQNGAVIHETTTVAVAGCPHHPTKHKAKKKTPKT